MEKNAKIYVAGHRGMVGSAIVRELKRQGYHNLVLRTHKELDLTRQNQVEAFFSAEKPEYVFLAAAKVGGIMGNATAKADFICFPFSFIENSILLSSPPHYSYSYYFIIPRHWNQELCSTESIANSQHVCSY